MKSIENELLRIQSNQSLNVQDLFTIEGQERYLSIKLSIKNTGEGISKEGQDKLFIDFNKLQENQTRNRQGTGLGLSICKEIIEQMGGSVEVKNEIGKGTEFIINIKTKCKVKSVKLDGDQEESKHEDLQIDQSNIKSRGCRPFVFIEKNKNK